MYFHWNLLSSGSIHLNIRWSLKTVIRIHLGNAWSSQFLWNKVGIELLHVSILFKIIKSTHLSHCSTHMHYIVKLQKAFVTYIFFTQMYIVFNPPVQRLHWYPRTVKYMYELVLCFKSISVPTLIGAHAAYYNFFFQI